jgi:hypothetical protein
VRIQKFDLIPDDEARPYRPPFSVRLKTSPRHGPTQQGVASRDAVAAPRQTCEFSIHQVSDQVLLAEYCEALVAAAPDPAKKTA